MRLMYPLHRYLAPCGAPFFLLFLAFAAQAHESLLREPLGADYALARESVIEAIEHEGLVVGAILPFADMLERTRAVQDRGAALLSRGEVIQFCSATIARAMVAEDAAQIALCPMSVALYVEAASDAPVMLAARLHSPASPARQAANALVQAIVRRAKALIGLP